MSSIEARHSRRRAGPSSSSSKQRPSSSTNHHVSSLVPQYVTYVVIGFLGFFAGTSWTMHSGITDCNVGSASFATVLHNDPRFQSFVEEIVQRRLADASAAEAVTPGHKLKSSSATGRKSITFPDTTSRYAVGMSRIDKLDFANHLDMGVPLDIPTQGNSDVLMIYNSKSSLPKQYERQNNDDDTNIPSFPAQTAVENCDYVNIVLTDHSRSRNQCIAIVPQYESYHIQKWMRVDADAKTQAKKKLDSSLSLQMVSRGMKANGANDFAPPTEKHIYQNWDLLSKYFANYEQSLQDLKNILDAMQPKDNTVIVMVSNFGQSELMVNFVCAAQRRNLDISQVLVFATDEETHTLAKSLGLQSFYDARNFADSMPSEAAGNYGDHRFTAMMMAKVICVQMVSALHYSILFQDVDIVWYKHPLQYFQNQKNKFDVYFQDDGGHSVRYAPYSANSGFYYVEHNKRTQYFFTSLLLAGDLILKTDSHQQALIALLSEHVSLYGLKVKVMSRDTPEFPGGYQYHQASGKYMRAFFKKEVDPYIFHMSWTKNKDNKLLFFQQLGDWYVNEQCVHKKVEEVDTGGSSFVSTCCAAEPLFSCHYRDKPSVKPCKDSPPIDAGHRSWWN